MADFPFVETLVHLHDTKHPTLHYVWPEPEARHGFLPHTDPPKPQRYRFRDFIAGFPPDDRTAQFYGNAERIFRIQGGALHSVARAHHPRMKIAAGWRVAASRRQTRAHHPRMRIAAPQVAPAMREAFRGHPACLVAVPGRPCPGRQVCHPGHVIKAAFVGLPGDSTLDLRDHQTSKITRPWATANPGHVHLCLAVTDAQAARTRALASGARPVMPEGPARVDAGPNRGARAAFLRIHDDNTPEFRQPGDTA